MHVINKDIVHEEADALVNAANSYLKHDGGLARVFVQNGGASIVEDSFKWVETFGTVAVGGCAITTAGNLKNTKYLIHVAGPNWNQNKDD